MSIKLALSAITSNIGTPLLCKAGLDNEIFLKHTDVEKTKGYDVKICASLVFQKMKADQEPQD